MNRLALIALVAATALFAPPAAADDCVTATLNLVYFHPEPDEPLIGITENLDGAPKGDTITGPAPPPAPVTPGGGMIGGGPPDCPPIVRPANDPTAQLICQQATGYGAWVCHTDALGNLVIEDVRYATIAIQPPEPPPARGGGSHGGNK